MTPKALKGYLVNTETILKKPAKTGSFLSNAKKNKITKGSKTEDLANNVDKILYGK